MTDVVEIKRTENNSKVQKRAAAQQKEKETLLLFSRIYAKLKELAESKEEFVPESELNKLRGLTNQVDQDYLKSVIAEGKENVDSSDEGDGYEYSDDEDENKEEEGNENRSEFSPSQLKDDELGELSCVIDNVD